MPTVDKDESGLSRFVVAAIAAGLLISNWVTTTIVVVWIVVGT